MRYEYQSKGLVRVTVNSRDCANNTNIILKLRERYKKDFKLLTFVKFTDELIITYKETEKDAKTMEI